MKKLGLRGFLTTLLICLAVLGGLYMLSRTGIYIKDASNNQLPQGMISNTLTVDGEGKVFAQPDVLNLNIEVSETKANTQLAQTSVNEKITKIHDILKAQNIDINDVQTTNVSVYPEYDYTTAGSKLKGYRAAHNLLVKIKKINTDNKDKGSTIMDQIAAIGGVTIQNISYDIEDKTDLYSQARKLAMGKASQKASEMAKVAGVKLLKPMSISESVYSNVPRPMYNQNYAMEAKVADAAGGTSISLGQLEITLNVNVIYGIE